jgi:hypothetical protein
MALWEVCLKTFFWLTGAYEGKYVRRLKQFGRLVFYRVVRDPEEIIQEPYWLIHIEAFSEGRDRPIVRHLSKFGNGWFRFAHLKEAQTRFEQLCSLPQYASDEISRQNRRVRASEAAKARCIEKGGLRAFIRKKQAKNDGAGHSGVIGEPGTRSSESGSGQEGAS